MKRPVSFMLVPLILFCPVSSVFAWGGDGHKTVGKIASLRIKPRTARAIALILKPGETLASISTWADTVKERIGQTDPDPDTNAFLQDIVHNEKNREWHYDDLPLNCRSYHTCGDFTVDHDVVNMLRVSIRTLQGNPSPDYPLSKRNALRLLVHLAGDIHQPLHVGAGFIDVNGPNRSILIVKDPATIKRKQLPHDRGGNELVIDNDRQNLHGYWDFELVKSLMTLTNHPTSETLGPWLKRTVSTHNNWQSRGRVETWPAQWATDSLHFSRNHTYRSLRIVGKRSIPVMRDNKPVLENGQPVMQTVFDVPLPRNYEVANREVVRLQLAKAGFRLAKMLDAIYAR